MAGVSARDMSDAIRIGTRGSKLALAQASIVQRKCSELGIQSEVSIIQTTGDVDKETPLSELGGKGVFIKSIESALLNYDIDLAVHSFKDLTCVMPDGLELSGCLSAESVSDVAVMAPGLEWDRLPAGSKIGTGSLRRKAFIHRYWPHLEVVPIRGNVESRIEMISTIGLSAVILSEVGLMRLGLDSLSVYRFNTDHFIPAPGQGVIALQCRAQDQRLLDINDQLSDIEQKHLSKLDYYMLSSLSFNCEIPLGMYGVLKDGKYRLKSTVFSKDLKTFLDFDEFVPKDEAHRCIESVASQLKAFLDEDI